MVPEYWLWFLLVLLPVAAWSGWWTARRALARDSGGRQSDIHPDYFRGLNYVLNEQPDKAIEVFIRMLEVDSETIETHLALGNLFRRRGEVDRAIRIHQNLIARPTLSTEQRFTALMELGMDYMRLGLLDRAEGLFLELRDSDSHTVQAHRQLLIIYQQEQDWHEAISTARKLESLSGDNLNPVIAQFYCELASIQLANGKEKQAHDDLKRALNLDPRCVRASILEGDINRRNRRYKDAIRFYKRVEHQDPEYIPEIIEPMLQCYYELNSTEEFIGYLKEVLETYDGITPALFVTDILSQSEGEEEAIHFISSELKKHPSVRGVDRLLEFAINRAQGETRENLATIKGLTRQLIENRPVYRCLQCGFDAKLLHWQCPGCREWNSVKPVHGIHGE